MSSCLHARTLTIDVDGTVLCTGSEVGGAARGFNPHHRKVPGYYPVTAFLAESGHLLRLHNRPGTAPGNMLRWPPTWRWAYAACGASWRAAACMRRSSASSKSALALDTIPTHQYEANSAWQQLVVLAHNLLANFQIETGVMKRPHTHKRTTHWVLRSGHALRFEIIHRAGRLVRPQGRLTLRLQRNKR